MSGKATWSDACTTFRIILRPRSKSGPIAPERLCENNNHNDCECGSSKPYEGATPHVNGHEENTRDNDVESAGIVSAGRAGCAG